MNETWEEYKKTHKKELERDEADIELNRLKKWADLLVFRIKNKRRGVENAIEGIKRSTIEVEKLYKDRRFETP